MTAEQTNRAETLVAALESADFQTIEPIVEDYLAWFHSTPRLLSDVSAAKDLFTSGLSIALARRCRLAAELARVTKLQTGYRLPPTFNTWQIHG